MAAQPIDGSEIPRPAASADINIIQPRPAYSGPPMIFSSGINTSLPVVGPFMNMVEDGIWRLPVSTPARSVGTNAQVIPISWVSPISPSGSRSLNANPSTVQTGATVIYRLAQFRRMPKTSSPLHSPLQMIPSSIIAPASDPASALVSPNAGNSRPSARRGSQ